MKSLEQIAYSHRHDHEWEWQPAPDENGNTYAMCKDEYCTAHKSENGTVYYVKTSMHYMEETEKEVCSLGICDGSGTYDDGEHDNIVTFPCPCREVEA